MQGEVPPIMNAKQHKGFFYWKCITQVSIALQYMTESIGANVYIYVYIAYLIHVLSIVLSWY